MKHDFSKFKNVKDADLKEVNADATYLTFEKPGTFNFAFCGTKSFKKDGKNVEAVLLEDQDGNKLIAAATQLVNASRELKEGSLIRVKYIGEKTTDNGNMKEFKVYVLQSA